MFFTKVVKAERSAVGTKDSSERALLMLKTKLERGAAVETGTIALLEPRRSQTALARSSILTQFPEPMLYTRALACRWEVFFSETVAAAKKA